MSPADGTVHTEIQEFIDLVFETIGVSEEMIVSLNPLEKKELFIDGEDGQKRIIIDCDFHRIIENEKVIIAMVTFTDHTNVMEAREELEDQQQKSENELSLIEAVLRIDEISFSEFMNTCREIIQELSSPPENNDALIEKLDSVKTNAQNWEVVRLGEITHTIAHELSANPESLLLKSLLVEFVDVVKSMEGIKQRFLQTISSPASSSSPNLIEFRNSVENIAAELSADLKKMVKLSIRGNIQHLPMLPDLRSALLHLIYNSFEHGIESPQERIDAGKDESGRIELVFSRQNMEYKIIIADDGKGIDFAVVEKQARTLGLIEGETNRDELVKLLFSSRFSTKNRADSKREDGLDTVQKGGPEFGRENIRVYRRWKGYAFYDYCSEDR